MDTFNYYHEEVCDYIKKIFAAKNADYGDSFRITRSEVPYYTLGKLSDKYNRIKTLMLAEELGNVKDESIEDTLIDLANYAIMEVACRRFAVDKAKEDAEEAEDDTAYNECCNLDDIKNKVILYKNNNSNDMEDCRCECQDGVIKLVLSFSNAVKINGECKTFKVDVWQNSDGYLLKFFYPEDLISDDESIVYGAKRLADCICHQFLHKDYAIGILWDDEMNLYCIKGITKADVLNHFVFLANALYDNYCVMYD